VVYLVTHGSLHVKIVVHLTGERRVGLAVSTDGDKREFVLQSVNFGVIIRGSRAINSPENPNNTCGRFIFGDSCWQSARPSRSGDGVLLRFAASGSLTGNLENIGPAIQHGHEVVAVAHVGNTEDPRFLGDVNKSRSVKSVCVGSSDGVVVHGGVRPQLDDLPHRPTIALDSRIIGDEFPCHVHGYKRIAIDVDVCRVADRLFDSGLPGGG